MCHCSELSRFATQSNLLQFRAVPREKSLSIELDLDNSLRAPFPRSPRSLFGTVDEFVEWQIDSVPNSGTLHGSIAHVVSCVGKKETAFDDGLADDFFPGRRVGFDLWFVVGHERWDLARADPFGFVIDDHPSGCFSEDEINHAPYDCGELAD